MGFTPHRSCGRLAQDLDGLDQDLQEAGTFLDLPLGGEEFHPSEFKVDCLGLDLIGSVGRRARYAPVGELGIGLRRHDRLISLSQFVDLLTWKSSIGRMSAYRYGAR